MSIKGIRTELAAGIFIAASAILALRAQAIVWASNVAADSFSGFTGFSFRQGLLLAIFSILLSTQTPQGRK